MLQFSNVINESFSVCVAAFYSELIPPSVDAETNCCASSMICFLSNLPTKLHLSVYHKRVKYRHWKVKVKAYLAALDIIP